MKKLFKIKSWPKAVSKLLSNLDYWWNKQTEQYYWFHVRYIYSKNGHVIFSWGMAVGLRRRNTILDNREIKKIPIPLHLDENKKQLLCNGDLEFEIISYLGRHQKRENKPKNRTNNRQ